MKFEIIQANKECKEVLANLMQFYIYDFSEFIKCDVEEDGLYGAYPLEDYWIEKNHRFPYLIKQNNKYVGFVLVRLIETAERDYYSIAEFFILKKYRREGIGKAVAARIFDLYKGQWEVYQIEGNKSAQIFWNKTIDEYTKGQFKERIENGRRIQDFIS
ncbi:GNAT family N-acetyltransferase [Paenibacillus taichungensis]|uniref:GNAT family N-acetyltransferase n=1 Tax=Paenibacillus taichungensis TaxID=484184 RepID=A0ABX2MG44_9BACL|nr:GNAT family N-acetyltransferase [Paenibacillus taichungensis]NUU53888.1 GNAT family N-acetyltransferase [Paenibacillus taichungensis]